MANNFLIPLLDDCDDVTTITILYKFNASASELPRGRVKFNFDTFSDDFCFKHFRFSKQDILRLRKVLRIPSYLKMKNGMIVSGIEAFCILLKRLSYPNRLIDLMHMFPRTRCELGRIFNSVVALIISKHGYLLENIQHDFINEEELMNMSTCIFNKGVPYKQCIGFLDGTVRPICRPLRNQRNDYNGHKRTHAKKFQSLMFPNGIIGTLHGPVDGRRHDAHILAKSKLLEQLQNPIFSHDGKPYFVYGDPAYPLRDHLIVPFKGPTLTVSQRVCNKLMSSVRETVEWGFAKIIQNWAFLDYKKNLKTGLQPVADYYKVATILTNCHSCLYGSQISDYFNCEPPVLETYLRYQ